MPRAFLITNKRYHAAVSDGQQNTESRETSPERRVQTAEEPSYNNFPFDLRRTSVTDAVTSGQHQQHYRHLSPHSASFSDVAAAEALLALLPASPRSPANLSRGVSPVSRDSSSSNYTRAQDLSLPHSPASSCYSGSDLDQVRSDNDTRDDVILVHHRNNRYANEQYEPLGLTVKAFRQPESVSIAAVLQRVITPKGLSQTRQQPQEDILEQGHSCPECGKRYSTSSNLARHRQTHRSVEDRRAARQCPHCDKVYVSMPAYSMHVRTHGQGCRCPYCGKCFSRPWLLQGHIRTHTGEKPFTCPICSKAFADKSNLRAHIQTHSSTKPFVCGRCGKAFALKSYLYKHEESSCMRLQSKIGLEHDGSNSSTNSQQSKILVEGQYA